MATKSNDLKLSSDVIVMKRSHDQLIVINSSNNEVFYQVKGEIACHSFELLSKGKPKEKVVKELKKKWDHAPLTRLEADLTSFINKLISLKILA